MATADLTIRQSDTLPALTSTLTLPTGSPVNLSGAAVSFVMRTLTSNTPVKLAGTASVVTAASGKVRYSWAAADTASSGLYMGEWHVTLSTGKKYTWPNNGYLSISVQENLTTPGGQRLVSLTDAKDYLNIRPTDHTQDAKLLRFICSLTPTVESICGPILLTEREEWHDGGQTFVRVRRRPSSGYGTSPVLTLLAASEYRGPIEYTLSIVQDPSFGSIYSVMMDMYGIITRRTAGGGVMAFPAMPRSVHIVYVAGQSSVPANVYEGTLELCRLHYQQTQQGRPRANAPAMVQAEGEASGPPLGYFVPGSVRERMAPTKRAPSIA